MTAPPIGEVTGWAGHRLLDTVIGRTIALIAPCMLWPRDSDTAETVPGPAAA